MTSQEEEQTGKPPSVEMSDGQKRVPDITQAFELSKKQAQQS